MIFSHHAQIACRLLKYEALAKIRSLFNDLPTLFFMKVLYVITGVGLAVILAAIAHILTEPDDAESALRVTAFANAGHAAPIIGMERGIFVNEIPDVDVELKIFDSGPQAIESLFSGSSDMAYVGPGPAVNGFLRSDGDVIILRGAASNGASFVVQENSGIDSIAKLDGMRVAAPLRIITSPSDLRNPLTAGPGPTYAISEDPENSDSIACGPLSKIFNSTSTSGISFTKIPRSMPIMGAACPAFAKAVTRRADSASSGSVNMCAMAASMTASPTPVITYKTFIKKSVGRSLNNDRILARASYFNSLQAICA